MSSYGTDMWHSRQRETDLAVRGGVKETWIGPVNTELYGKNLTDLCNRTNDNLTRISLEMRKLDPCLEFGMKHWHPSKRPASADRRIDRPKSKGKWENLAVMFTDNKTIEDLPKPKDVETDSYIDAPGPVNKFCYLCSTMEEHKRHIHLHKPRKRVQSAKARIAYIAPAPKQKPAVEEEEELVKERLYKIEVFTSEVALAGTNANVYVTIKGSMGFLPRQQLTKKRGCSKMCFVRASKETFHIQGPFLGWLEILTIEHDGKKRNQGWHLERIEVTDVKALKTWVFWCDDWLSTFEKPHYSNKRDLVAEDKQRPQTVYINVYQSLREHGLESSISLSIDIGPCEFAIEVHTGKQKMAGTDANVFITLFGSEGSSKKIHLVDPSSNKKCFEKNSIDKFQVQLEGIGELRRIRIEHDGKGFAAGWHLNQVVIVDSRKPKQKYYFLYNGWIAKDEGEGKLWREITAKKSLPKELQSGTTTKYHIMVKTGDVRFAGTDANVFIQMSGANGMTPKIKLDDAKNNFERDMVDNFDIEAVNVGPLQGIIIGHDNSGPGPGWFLDHVEIRRFLPRDEVLERLKRMKKRLKADQKKRSKDPDILDDSSEDEDDMESLRRKLRKRELKKDDKERKRSKSAAQSSSEDEKEYDRLKRKLKKQMLKRENKEHRRSRSAELSSSDEEADSLLSKLKKQIMNKDKKEHKRSKSATHSSSDDEDTESIRKKLKKIEMKRDKTDHKRSRNVPKSGGNFFSVSSESSDSSSDASSGEEDSVTRRRKRLKELKSRRPSSAMQQSRRSSSARERPGSSQSQRRISTSASGMLGKGAYRDEEGVKDLKVPLYEEYTFVCQKWLATDMDDGLCVRELPVAKKNTYYKE